MSRPFSTGVSPEATACFIEAIANDKAARMRTMAKATVVMCVTPEWMRAEEVNAVFGIPKNQLYRFAVEGKVIAKKLDPELRGSAVIFKAESVRRAIGRLTPYEEWAKEQAAKKEAAGTTETEEAK